MAPTILLAAGQVMEGGLIGATSTTLNVLLAVALIGGFYMAWNIGANDVANAFGTSVGSGALTIWRAIFLAAVCEFAGAFFVGAPVAKTISSKIIFIEKFSACSSEPGVLMGLGMVAALLGAAIWLNIATLMGQPVSTTHAIIGGVMGFGAVAAGPLCIRWGSMGHIALSWVVSPLVGGVLAYAVYRWWIRLFILDHKHPVYMAMAAMPLAMGALIGIVLFSIMYKGLPKLKLDMPLGQASLISLAAALAASGVLLLMIRKRMRRHGVVRAQRYDVVERWFGYMQIATACYMSFAHGANDVANAIGPLAGAIQAFRSGGDLPTEISIPPWILAFGGVGIVIGLATYGHKVIEAIGKKITEITPTRGFSAELATATTVLVFSKLGMPISTTFVIVGAVMGVGFARGFGAIDLKVIRGIFASWLITIPASAVLTAIIFWILRAVTGF